MAGAIRVHRNSKGVWYTRLYFGRGSDGKPVQRYKSFPEAETEQDALRLATAWAGAFTRTGVQSMLLTDLLGEYIEAKAARDASANSLKAYRQILGNYCTRFLGGMRADELTPLDFTRFFTNLRNHGSMTGGELSANTVNGVYQFLNGAYKYFVGTGICSANPLAGIEKPKIKRYEAQALEEWDLHALGDYLDAALSGDASRVADRADISERERTAAFGIWLALNSGMRVSEVCAMRRRDVSRAMGYLHVCGSVIEASGEQPRRQGHTKSGKSRNVSLVPSMFDTIYRFLAWQDGEYTWCRADAPIVSTTGDYMAPNALSGAFSDLVKRLRLDPKAHFHTLRHTHASWCLAHGVDLITLSERLGHADPSTTARIYGHMIAGRDMVAAEAFASAMGSIMGEDGE